jgi:FAD:protein FMN transferase
VPGAADGYGRADGPGPRGGAEVDGGLGIEGPRELRDVRRFSHEAMATVFEVYAVHPDERYAAQAAQAAFDLTDRLERELSRFLTNSDIARVNHLAAGETTRVSPSTLECLVIARHVFDLTGGAFDVSIGTGLPSLDLDPDDFLVRATTGGVQVDLGGIGKGYAVDRMAELLEEWGLGMALVHGGFSSVLALEPPTGREGWPLTLSDPSAPSRVLARLSVRQTALGASGLRKVDHIVDPRTGEPARGRLAAWVAVPRPEVARTEAPAEEGPRVAAAAVTDALTTAFMLLSPEEIEGLCERTPGLEAWILPEPAGRPHGETHLLHFGGPAD